MLLVLLAAGLWLVRAGALPWWAWLGATALTIVMRVLAMLDAPVEELAVSGEGLTRRTGSPLRQRTIETVRWDELTRVEVLAHETGPQQRDPLFLLHGQGGAGVAIPGPLAERHGLVAQLRQRLGGLREQALADALAAPERARFVLWDKDEA